MATLGASNNNNNDTGGFADLAAGSLPTLGGGSDPLLPSWSRSLSELQAASQSLLVAGARSSAAGNAASLLGTDRTEFGRLTSNLAAENSHHHNGSRSTSSSSSHLLPEESFTTVAQLLQKQQNDILENLLTSARESADRTSQELTEKQLQDDWEREKEWWMQDIVGTRTLGGASASGNNMLTNHGSDNNNNDNHSLPKALPAPYPTAATPRFLGGALSASTVASASLDPKTAQAHLQVLQKVATSTTTSSSGPQAARDLLAKLQALTDASSIPEDSFYHTAWDFVGCLLERSGGSTMDHSMGVLVHLSRQFQSMIVQRVRAASLAGQDVSTLHNYGSGMVSTIAAHVQLEFGSSQQSIWHMLYFCTLREK